MSIKTVEVLNDILQGHIMKTLTITLGLLSSFALLMGSETMSIDQEIQAIKTASQKERVQLMNAFKLKLAKMNEAERNEALIKLRAQIRVQTNKQTDAEGKELTKRLNERNKVMQMDQNQKMHQSQQMQQKQAGSQFAQGQQGASQQMPINTMVKPSPAVTPQH